MVSRKTATGALVTAASDAGEQIVLPVWLQVGRTQGFTQVGEIRSPAELPVLLRQVADDIERQQP